MLYQVHLAMNMVQTHHFSLPSNSVSISTKTDHYDIHVNGKLMKGTLITNFITTSVVIGTECIGSCKSNYHTIMATMALICIYVVVCLIYL